MKRIIDGLKYDTDTAEKLHEWDNGIYGNDFKAHDETLYKTKNGRYFIRGWSGAMGPYSEPVGNNGRGEGSAIIPMSRDEAFTWLSDHDGEEVAEKEFPDLITEA
jgi:hypothetical protein